MEVAAHLKDLRVWAVLAALPLVGCPKQGGVDVHHDPVHEKDAGPALDASMQVDSGSPDAGMSAAQDSGPDAGSDAALDAGMPTDAGLFADFDAAGSLFAAAYGVFAHHCNFCHVRGGIGLSFGRLDLSTPQRAHASLVDQLAKGGDCRTSNATLVVKGDSAHSLLVQKLEHTQTCGVGMPDKFPDLAPDEIALVKAWIDAGAPYDMPGTPELPAAPSSEYPPLLSQTGLFSDVPSGTLAAGVIAYQPKYGLWSDGATKRRWLYLPPGTRIDTSNMDYWVYPVGTKAWKEFSRDGTRVETRMLHKVAADHWVMISYQWRQNLSDADAQPDGVSGANGTQHDIPEQRICASCHDNMKDKLLGVSALQLSHDLPGITLTQLAQNNQLTNPPASAYTLPGDSDAERALGILHANCGHCHNPASHVYRALTARTLGTSGPDLWERTGSLSAVEQTIGYLSTVGAPNMIIPELHIIEPGKADQSELVVRMSERSLGSRQMPPIGTNIVDTTGLNVVKSWINSLPTH